MWGAFGVFLQAGATSASGRDRRWPRRMASSRRRSCARKTVVLFDGLVKIALAEAEARAKRSRPRRSPPRRRASDRGSRAIAHLKPNCSGARGDILPGTKPRQPRACGRVFPGCHRHRTTARNAQLLACVRPRPRQTLPIDRSSHHRPRHSSPALEGFRQLRKCPRSPRRRRCGWLSRPARMESTNKRRYGCAILADA